MACQITFSGSATTSSSMWWFSSFLFILFFVSTRSVRGIDATSALEEQMKVLGKQVQALLERRKEDLESIEFNMRKNLFASPEIADVKQELAELRRGIESLRSGNAIKSESVAPSRDNNDHLTLKWLSNNVAELKMEMAEFQAVLNSSLILQTHEKVDSELGLLQTDVANLNKELETARNKNAKYEAEILQLREEVGNLRDQHKIIATVCEKTKSQLKSTQLEWAHNWKKLNDYMPSSPSGSPPEEFKDHPSRHQRLLKKHIIDLEKIAKRLNKRNDDLEAKITKLEEQVKTSTNPLKPTPEDSPDVIYGNEIEEYLQMNKLNPVDGRGNANWFQLHEKIQELESFQKSNADSIQNLSKQLSNFDKLHMSMLELLENVENIENKIDRNFPEFRKEISKLEFQMSDAFSQVALLKEDQTNTRDSVKAISVTVSYLKDKRDGDLVLLQDVQDRINSLKKSNTVQNSKLHDHIFKVESSTVDMNSTKSTIHLVEELKSFEKEYKSIVNKLPHDCSAVSGPNGVYLISPGDGEPIMAYCKEGWTTIQKRYDGSVDFNRKWNEYSNGFGSATGEHWLGNRNIHYLTKDNCSTLEINMKDIYGKYWQATYDTFWVGDYTVGFKMLVGDYKGNASDAMDYQNRMEFSTIDNDRDISNTHCASNYEGGWWFSHCQHANLNGRYNLGLTWFDSSRNEWIAVATSEMRLKRKPNCS